jgi:FeS assembly SUF system regulator
MRLSRLADFAVVLMTHVAQHHEQIHSAAEITLATQLPAPTVAKVLTRLCHAGLLSSVRGVKGGYRLARPSAMISVGTIVSVFDGPVALTQCLRSGLSRCEVETVCPSRVGLHRINAAVLKALDDVSLADIAVPAPELQTANRPAASRAQVADKAQG